MLDERGRKLLAEALSAQYEYEVARNERIKCESDLKLHERQEGDALVQYREKVKRAETHAPGLVIP